MQVDRAGDLGIDPNNMWAMAAPSTLDDPTPAAGKYLAGLGDNWTAPTDTEFGGNIMETDAKDHGAYYEVKKDGEPSTSLENQSRVIVGQHDEVILE